MSKLVYFGFFPSTRSRNPVPCHPSGRLVNTSKLATVVRGRGDCGRQAVAEISTESKRNAPRPPGTCRPCGFVGEEERAAENRMQHPRMDMERGYMPERRKCSCDWMSDAPRLHGHASAVPLFHFLPTTVPLAVCSCERGPERGRQKQRCERGPERDRYHS